VFRRLWKEPRVFGVAGRVDMLHRRVIFMWHHNMSRKPESKLDLLQGTLDLMVLQTLDAMGPLHGYGVARRIEQLSGNEVLLNQGTIYASLVRLQQRGWIAAAWGVSDNNRKAKFYSITKAGKRQMKADKSHWERLAAVMGRVLAAASGGGKG
jgi:PadR family transcriptional regulator PadR